MVLIVENEHAAEPACCGQPSSRPDSSHAASNSSAVISSSREGDVCPLQQCCDRPSAQVAAHVALAALLSLLFTRRLPGASRASTPEAEAPVTAFA